MQHLEFTRLALTDLTPFPGNAKAHDLDELRRSLRRGQFQPIVVRRVDGGHVILAGNGTFQAAELEDWPTIECKVVECTDEEALWINLAANRIGERGGYDTEALAALLEELDGDFLGTGWDQGDLDELTAALEAASELPFVAPQVAPAALPGLPGVDGPERAGTGAGGTRELVVLLGEDDHDELQGHLTALRALLKGNTLTNGDILLVAARTFRQMAHTHAGHSGNCECSVCTIWADAVE